ncbi:cobyrinate a,c-diamide synthase [Flavobacterium davisii]|nr:cobyrinate a,c-diamide synthase [Flavobacterium columnare]
MKPQFLIAAPSSNSGKTTITLGLLRLLKNKGYNVQAFKCGPDYIDTKHHTKASGQPSINLDTYMMNEHHVKTLYHKYSQEADISIIEGVMGLFDGANRMQGSSAEIAILLDIPVILVVNAKSMAYSIAPLLFGLKNFNPNIKIAGVIFNFVNTESHYSFLKDACNDVGIDALGYLPSNPEINIPSRHLGLFISPENDYELIIENAAKHLAQFIDISRILSIGETSQSNYEKTIYTDENTNKSNPFLKNYKIAVAHDDAFNFTYFENIKALKKMGEIIYFSPLKDVEMPEADVLYLAGGYPELYLDQLATNTAMRESIFDFCSNGGKVIAECGGMMYLGDQIIDSKGVGYSMVGFLPIQTSMEKAQLSLGYREVQLNNQTIKGHEFHYSKVIQKGNIATIGNVFNAKGIAVPTPIYMLKNVVASYIHFYWGDSDIISYFF